MKTALWRQQKEELNHCSNFKFYSKRNRLTLITFLSSGKCRAKKNVVLRMNRIAAWLIFCEFRIFDIFLLIIQIFYTKLRLIFSCSDFNGIDQWKNLIRFKRSIILFFFFHSWLRTFIVFYKQIIGIMIN